MEDFEFDPVLVVILTTTVSTRDDARALAEPAVQGQLAACAQIEAIESHYVWQGKLCDEPEWRIVFKTLPQMRSALVTWLDGAHPYEVPQMLLREEHAGTAYAAWIREQLSLSS